VVPVGILVFFLLIPAGASDGIFEHLGAHFPAPVISHAVAAGVRHIGHSVGGYPTPYNGPISPTVGGKTLKE
jgi:hypothetical protein